VYKGVKASNPDPAALLGLAGVFWAQFIWVERTNFWGFDEWLHLSLTTRGIVDFPYANRPLMLLWSLPAALVVPHSLWAFYWLHASYLMLVGCLVYLLCRRLAPRHVALAFLSGVFACFWAPQDLFRLSTLAFTGYSGLTFATYLAALLFVESWRRASRGLLLLALLVGFAAARGGEVVIPLLAATPVALLVCERRPARQLRLWLAAWVGLLLVVTGLTLRPLVLHTSGLAYQTDVLGSLDLTPLGVLGRLHFEYDHHLLPLAGIPRGLIWHPGVAIAVTVFAFAWFLLRGRQPAGSEARFAYLVSGGVGLLVAALGYAPFVLSPNTGGPARTQFLSTPGIALFLASMICLLGTWVGPRWRQLAIVAPALWVVAIGTGRTLQMQRDWDLINAFRWQTDTLEQLTARAPDLEPGTLVVLIDERNAWPASFSFRHAVEYVYQGRAAGHVWGGWDLLYPTSFEPGGVRCEPWPSIREVWDAPATFHRHDEIVVVRYTGDGRLLLLEDWPDVLPRPAPGARYDPSSRILPASLPIPQRAILSQD
jgi:hypothetical protein